MCIRDRACMAISVVVGFLYILKLRRLLRLYVVTSRKFNILLCSTSIVNLILLFMPFKKVSNQSICLGVPPKIKNVSSTYRVYEMILL